MSLESLGGRFGFEESGRGWDLGVLFDTKYHFKEFPYENNNKCNINYKCIFTSQLFN